MSKTNEKFPTACSECGSPNIHTKYHLVTSDESYPADVHIEGNVVMVCYSPVGSSHIHYYCRNCGHLGKGAE